MNGAKVFIVLASMCVLVLAQDGISKEHMEKVMGYHKECQSETNIDEDLAVGVLTGQFKDDPVLKKHMFCMSKKLGIQNEAGEIQTDKLREKIGKAIKDEDKVAELTEKCGVAKDSPEETSFELAKCVYEATHS